MEEKLQQIKELAVSSRAQIREILDLCLEMDKLVSTKSQSDLEQENQKYINENISYLQAIHDKQYTGTADDAPDDFDNWMERHELGELVAMIDNAKSR